jgi:hypothetical protein
MDKSLKPLNVRDFPSTFHMPAGYQGIVVGPFGTVLVVGNDLPPKLVMKDRSLRSPAGLSVERFRVSA